MHAPQVLDLSGSLVLTHALVLRHGPTGETGAPGRDVRQLLLAGGRSPQGPHTVRGARDPPAPTRPAETPALRAGTARAHQSRSPRTLRAACVLAFGRNPLAEAPRVASRAHSNWPEPRRGSFQCTAQCIAL